MISVSPAPIPENLTKLYVDGQYVEPVSKATYPIYNPKDGSKVADHVPIAGKEDVDAAVAAAEQAFSGPWSTFSAIQRSECFYKLVAILDDKLVEILTLDSLTTGNPVSLIPTREKNYIKNCLLYYGESYVAWQ